MAGNPFQSAPIRLQTRLSPSEMAEQLSARLARRTWTGNWRTLFGENGEGLLTGRVTARGFVLRKPICGRNSSQTEAHGRYLATPDGTEIALRVGMSRSCCGFSRIRSSFCCSSW